MPRVNKPRCGSLAVYPRKKAKKETPSFSSFPVLHLKDNEGSRPLNFFGYKAGMTHIMGKDSHEKGTTFGHEVSVSVTVIETPPIKVFGARAYCKAKTGYYGTVPLMDVFAQSQDKHLLRRMPNFRQKKSGKEKQEGKAKKEAHARGIDDLAKEKARITEIRLLCHSQPVFTTIGKKKPAIFEVALCGNVGQQLSFAKEKLGKELRVNDVFSQLQFIDVRAVSKGKGMQGPVKRFGVRTLRRKAKKEKIVGSIGPWHPATVMWTVPRPGQMGYHSRTEYNKRILRVGAANEAAGVSPAGGFKNYGGLQSDFLIVAGSVVGPAKRAIGLRQPIRKLPVVRNKVDSIDYIATSGGKDAAFIEEDGKAQKVQAAKEEKAVKKSVEDEILTAAKGEEKREKKKEI